MQDPNDLVEYIFVEVEQADLSEDTPEWLLDFLRDDDYFDMSR
jgi:hypothetical protein